MEPVAQPIYELELLNPITYEEAVSMKNNISWDRLSGITVGKAIEQWLTTCRPLTAKNYKAGMNQLAEHGYVRPNMSLQAFSLLNQEAIVDQIKHTPTNWSECTRQARAACYISFTGFLHRQFGKLIQKALPCREGKSRTFFKVREKVATEAMTLQQSHMFLEALASINARDCMMAKVILQGAKRVNEVIRLTSKQIDWEKGIITFQQSKTTSGSIKEIMITYPVSVINELRKYAVNENWPVFTTKTGKPVCVLQLAKTFEKAGKIAQIPFKVTPHVLRATAITAYKRNGCADSDVMKISGHSSAGMVNAYDKTEMSDNPSKRFNLVC